MSTIIYQSVVHINIYPSLSTKIIGGLSTNKHIFCFENNLSYMVICMCKRVNQDLRHGTGHVDIQVRICMIYLNVCLVAIT